ncbi:MAG: hypothetical protein JST05_01220 [Acidobacteria bacterium]|nr:hypothetical protein [Acidobacteriota bacterium]
MKLVKLPSGKVLNLAEVFAFDVVLGEVNIICANGVALRLVHDDARAMKAYLEASAEVLEASPRAETLAGLAGGGN